MSIRSRTSSQRLRNFGRNDAIGLALTITGSRQQFADAFRRAQAGGREVLELEAVASDKTDTTAAFAQGFLRAVQGDFLVELCVACLQGQIVGPSFTTAVADISDDARLANLQQIIDAHRGIRDAGLLINRLPRAARQVCQIEIDGYPRGTGFLVRSDLVMTAYHVIKPLLLSNEMAKPGSAVKLRVRFDYSRREGPDGAVMLDDGIVCRVADPWLVKCSPCTAEELLNMLPQDEESLKDFWDFAVIRLEELPGVARPGLEIGDLPVRPGHRLMILQHPQARPVGFDSSTVRRFLGTGAFRIVHQVNTEDGSSGSPCLNDDFKVVGLHQAKMPETPGRRPRSKKSGDQAPENRAIPMPRILGLWKLRDAPPLGPQFVRILTVNTRETPHHPAFGRTRLQDWISHTAADGGSAGNQGRFLVVSGKKGSGKSFTIDVLRAILPSGDHAVLECRASDFSSEKTALGFATKYLLSPLGADAAGLTGLTQADTSDNAWLNYQLIGNLLTVIDQGRKNRMVWVVLDELDEVVLPEQGQVRRLLDLLYQRAKVTPWLRFLLLGTEAVPVPGTVAFKDASGPMSETALARDVGDYLLRSLESKGVFMDDATARATAETFVGTAVAACDGKLEHESLMRLVARTIISFEEKLEVNRRLRADGQ